MSSASPEGSVSNSSTPTRFTDLSFASRSPISAPGFGVLTISLSGSVVLIHSDTRLVSAVANTGAPVLPISISASDQ